MKELTYLFQNPNNSCEEIYICKETKVYYALLPYTPYSKQLCTCSHYRGFFEADCPVKAGMKYILKGSEILTHANGEVIDYRKKNVWENEEKTYYFIKPEFLHHPNYELFSPDRLFAKPYEYMQPEHMGCVTLKNKEVLWFMNGYYRKLT